MSEKSLGKSSGNADFKIAVGALACIVLGASVCYVITRVQPKKTDVEPVAAKSMDSGYVPLTFATLSSFAYEIPPSEGSDAKTKAPRDPIPAPIKAFDGKNVAIQGFMVPIALKDGRTTAFLLVRDQSICCNWGRIPRMNEWVSVRMKAGTAAHVVMDQPVTVFGVFDAGEIIDHGEVLSLYRLDADDVAGPLDL